MALFVKRRGNSGRDHVPQTVRGSGYSSPRSNPVVSFTQPTARAKPTDSVYPDDKGYVRRVHYEPKNFWDWYVNYSNPFYASAHVLEDTISTGLKNAGVGNKTSGSGIRDLFKAVASSFGSGSRSGSRSGSGSFSSGDSSIPSTVPDYLNADLARHYGMDAATAYSEALANTSHQREVKDLQAAGLNPVLSTRYGGASGVSGASVYAPAPEASSSSGAVSAKEASVLSGLASGVVGLVTGSSAKANATEKIVNALSGIVSSFTSSR